MADFNEYTKRNSHVEMLISSKTHGDYKILISYDDYDLIKNYKWSLTPRYNKTKGKFFYVQNKEKGLLHRFICNTNKEMVDHINGNTLDNRRENLCGVTRSQNGQNRRGYGKIKIKFLSYNSKRPGHNASYTIKFPGLERKTFVDINKAKAYYLECLLEYGGKLTDVR